MSFWLGLPAGIALCALSGYAVGSICLRSKGHYFAIFTMAVGIIIHLVIQNWESLTHGHIGVIGIPGPGPIGPISFDSAIARSYLALFFLVVTAVATSRLVRSPVGRTLMAVRESEPLAAAVGLDVMAAKRLAFTISAALAGLAGGLFAGFIGFLGPESANVEMTFNTLLYVMVGGIGSLSGPIAGTFIVYGLSQVLAVLQQYQMVIFGLALVLLIRLHAGRPRRGDAFADAAGDTSMMLLETHRLSKSFGGLRAVDEVDFAVAAGSITGIIGPNGAGKTTFFNVISRALPASSGRIVFDGQDVTTLQPHQVARLGVARTFQSTTLFGDATALENVLVGYRQRTKAGVLDALIRTGRLAREEQDAHDAARDTLRISSGWRTTPNGTRRT